MPNSPVSGPSGADPGLARIAAELKWLRFLLSVITVCVADMTLLFVFGQDAAVVAAMGFVVLLSLYGFARVSIWLVDRADRSEALPESMNNAASEV